MAVPTKKHRTEGPGGHLRQITHLADNTVGFTWVFSPHHHKSATIQDLGIKQIDLLKQFIASP